MFNPISASKNIKEEFVGYIATSFSFADKNLRMQFRRQLENNIDNGPWLETNDVFKSGKSISQLIGEGVLSPLYLDLEKGKDEKKYKKRLPVDRPLYLHQEEAIRAIVDGANVIVSTGTGSGKTNCFLIPVINDLLREVENNTLGPGVRALFIYPMNALANDQMKNIRKILMHYPDITFGVYNGATEQDQKEAIAVYEAMFSGEDTEELRHRLPNELLSREEMKKNPPNILFTNYAMLEHLLFRPKDDVLFSKSDFKYVVLDEAHVYAGATGIETAILLRRLSARIRATRQTQFILTSATLGNNNDSDEDVIRFATNLCGVEFNTKNIIRASRENFTPIGQYIKYPSQLFIELADESNLVKEILKKYNIKFDESKPESELLYDVAISSELYKIMRTNMKRVCKLADMQKTLGVDMETAISFISICTRAQKGGRSLIDSRYHYFIRSLEGCYVALSPQPQLFLTRKKHYFENDNQYCVFEIALCDDCGKVAIVGKVDNGYLVQSGKLSEDVEYFYLESEDNEEIDDEEDSSSKNVYYLCKGCGAIYSVDDPRACKCNCENKSYIKIVKAKDLINGARCGNCKTGVYKRFYLGNDAATSVLATALYEELPEITYEEDGVATAKTNNIFINAAKSSKKKEKKKGRQFLAFSDSRHEAAKFACYLEKSYGEFLRRRGICQVISQYKDSIINECFTISDFVVKLTALYSNKRSFAESNIDNSNLTTMSQKNAWVAMLNELARFNSTTSLTSLGVMQFQYLGNTDSIIDAISNNPKYNIKKEDVKNLLDLLSFEIVKMGAICSDSDTDIDDNDRTYIFYSPSQKFISKEDIGKPCVTAWMPKSKNGSRSDYYKSNKLNYVMKFLGVDVAEAVEFLDQYFDYLIDSENNPYPLIDKNKDGSYVLPAKYFRVRIAGDPNIRWYKCSKCGKVSQFNHNNQCIVTRCGAEVEIIEPNKLNEDNHFAKLYFSERMTPLFIKEHTAQLSKRESATYQEQFIKKEINALSCSTTFEMGVDVGDLETVFLRDVPPLPANYAQRAGRAGRSVNAAAYALTFAKLSSHDLSFFREPDKMISGIILPPIFKVDNEKIVRRHIYAVALSMFFAENESLYNHNNADKFINEKGYEKFLDWLNLKPSRLKNLLKQSIPNIDNLHQRLGIDDFGWLDAFCGDEGAFTILIREYEKNVLEFESLIKNFQKEKDLERAAKCKRKLDNYKFNKLIEFLARGNILPRYGFPVDTVELTQNATANNLNKLRLCRDLQVAIAEYAPSSEVIADGKMYTSRYIKKSNIGKEKQEWHTAYIGICSNKECQAVNYSITPITTEGVYCSSCGKKLNKVDFYESIEPRSGFVTERIAKEVPLTKQEKNYRTEDFYIGNTESKTIEKHKFKFNGVEITIESTTNDSLIVKSVNNFYVCPKCGFAYAEDEGIKDDKSANNAIKNKFPKITTERKHESLFGPYDCDCQELIRYTMHHTFNTDVAKISFDCNTSNYQVMVSTMFALLNAISKHLNIERRDIKACLSLKIIEGTSHYSIIIYDAVPGGAGHSRRLVTADGLMLQEIIRVALSSVENCSCEPSCYNCLRSYENQKIHEILDRRLASEFLKTLKGEVEILEDKH